MNDVSRETPGWPADAERLFPGDRCWSAARFAALLADHGVKRGLIGPREVPRLWERHLLNCAVLAEAVPPGASVCDVGSGAGLPGVVLAIARPDVAVTLVEPLLRRTTFLSEVVDELGLTQVRVVRARAEELHGREQFDVVTSRAVAPLGRLLEWSMPLVAGRGALVAMKGSSAASEVAASQPVWTRLGCRDPEVVTLDGSGVSRAIVVRVAWRDPARVSSELAPPSGTSGRGRRDRRPNRRNRP